MGQDAPIPASGAWRPGDPTGARRFAVVDGGRALRLEAGGELAEVTVAYETWGELDAGSSNAVLVLHALTGDSHAARARRAGAPAPRLVGHHDRARPTARHRPLLRRVRQRARRLPGDHRAGVPGSA